MSIVERSAQEISPSGNSRDTKNVDELRKIPAWVLLGEPGAGKTELFKKEAKNSDGSYLTIAEFLHMQDEEICEKYKEKVLFLDGLDEFRASANSNDYVLTKIRKKLEKIGNPFFRIACRAADWYGQSDRDDIKNASSDQKLLVFKLLVLSENDISEILQANFSKEEDKKDFITKAKQYGIGSLLGNPQTLKLLIQAYSEKNFSWPNTKSEVFELACKKQAIEPNKKYRDQDRARNNQISEDDILDAAGYLFAVMLLSGKSGIALDESMANDLYPNLKSYCPPDLNIANTAIKRTIFVLSASSDERMEPSHRTIAEYLAARWLAKKLDQDGLPLRRVLNVLLGYDKKTIQGLRGLYAWLASCSLKFRSRLIDIDPITVALYGDVKSMDKKDKEKILIGLKRETQEYSFSLLNEFYEIKPLHALYDKALENDFKEMLQTSARDNHAQFCAAITLMILTEIKQGEISNELLELIKATAADHSRREEYIRIPALKIWLTLCAPEEAIDFLEKILNGTINDSDDELTGLLLQNLYPKYIKPQNLLQYLHERKNQNCSGTYVNFWQNLSEIAEESHLPILLEELSKQIKLLHEKEWFIADMIASLVEKAINILGDSVTSDHLYSWLRMIPDEQDGRTIQDFLKEWFSKRSKRYKELLGLCFTRCANKNDFLESCFSHEFYYVLWRFRIIPPQDIGFWHFQQIQQTGDETLIKAHLQRALNTLYNNEGNQDLNFEMISVWAEKDLIRHQWLESLIVCEIPDWRVNGVLKQIQRENTAVAEKHNRTIRLNSQIENIRNGRANPALMYELSMVWSGNYIDFPGENSLQRFENYCKNYEEIYHAASAGFRNCLNRKDLPSVKNIIDLHLNERQHFLAFPCLLGISLSWQTAPEDVKSLPEDTLKIMVCFKLTNYIEETPDWFIYLIENRSALVADVFVEYARRALIAKKNYISEIYQLCNDAKYQKLARIVVPKLLKVFPLRAKTEQLQYLDDLLQFSLLYMKSETFALVEQKMALKSLDLSQKIYWLVIGILINPEKYEEYFWHYVDKSQNKRLDKRWNIVAKFLARLLGKYSQYDDISAKTLGKFIEILTPDADPDWRSGYVSQAMELGNRVHAFIMALAQLNDEESLAEINRLLALPSLLKFKPHLEYYRHQLLQRKREAAFSFLDLDNVTQILLNKTPLNHKDLNALVLDHLDDITNKIRTSNSDLYRQFLNEDGTHKNENSCRDVLLEQLRNSLRPFGIDCQPEGDYVGDKRADIRISVNNNIELPIEIKGVWHKDLWTAVTEQLTLYTCDKKKTGGYGIYLVLWSDNIEQTARPSDGGSHPKSSQDLKERLIAQIPETEQGISVRVLELIGVKPKCDRGPAKQDYNQSYNYLLTHLTQKMLSKP